MARRASEHKVHAFGPASLVGRHRRTLCGALPAEGPSSLSASEDLEQVTCGQCLRRLARP